MTLNELLIEERNIGKEWMQMTLKGQMEEWWKNQIKMMVRRGEREREEWREGEGKTYVSIALMRSAGEAAEELSEAIIDTRMSS
jgi:hypothetical protein